MGAWIEMSKKYTKIYDDEVAPLVGAWIEIEKEYVKDGYKKGRSPRGSVDCGPMSRFSTN